MESFDTLNWIIIIKKNKQTIHLTENELNAEYSQFYFLFQSKIKY